MTIAKIIVYGIILFATFLVGVGVGVAIEENKDEDGWWM